MIEKHSINDRDVWLEVLQQPANRPNPNTIPTEYFTARYYLEEPLNAEGKVLIDDDGQPKLFESPVAALNYINEHLLHSGIGRR
ncbi:MAG TPA: hypothetical protein VM101_02210 [Flavitalea sp.]|nr:hypothetical protein [Flavitalea sp.]